MAYTPLNNGIFMAKVKEARLNIKKLLIIDDLPIAVKFNPLQMLLTIGGSMKTYSTITMLLSDFFKVKKIDFQDSTNNRCRFIVNNVRRNTFEKGIEAVRAEGIIPSDVKNFGRIMR